MSWAISAKWIGIAHATKLIAQMAALAIFSRILPPSEYGLIAIATAATNLAHLIRDAGIGSAIVQTPTDVGDEGRTAAMVSITVLGTVIAVLLAAAAAPLAGFYEAPSLTPMLWLMACSFPIMSVTAVHQAILERSAQFKLLARVEVCATLTAVIVTVGLVAWTRNPVALAVQPLATAVLTSLQLWRACRWRPSFRPNYSVLRQFARFSSNLTASNVVNYVARNADVALIGKLLGAGAAGIYSLSYKIMLLPVQGLTFVLSRALFPAMSRMQSDLKELKRAYLRAVFVTVVLTAPLMGWIWLYRANLVGELLGEHWLGVIPLIAWLAPVGLIQCFTSGVGAVLMAKGRTDIQLKLGLFSGILFVAAFVGGARINLEVLAAFYLAGNVINLAVVLEVVRRLLSLSAYEIPVRLGIPFVSTILAIAVAIGASALIDLGQLAEMALGSCLGALIYFFAIRTCWNKVVS